VLEATKAIDPSKVVKANLPGSAANVGADQLIAFTKDRIGSLKAPARAVLEGTHARRELMDALEN